MPDDAIAGCDVLKRSIAELCIADHKNDPAILARWLGNKTIEYLSHGPNNQIILCSLPSRAARFWPWVRSQTPELLA